MGVKLLNKIVALLVITRVGRIPGQWNLSLLRSSHCFPFRRKSMIFQKHRMFLDFVIMPETCKNVSKRFDIQHKRFWYVTLQIWMFLLNT